MRTKIELTLEQSQQGVSYDVLIAFLTKSDASEGFEQIINFLNAHVIQYALMVNPTIYVSCIKQFWSSVSLKKTNDVMRLQALIDRRKVIITEDTVRQALRLDDADSIDCLPNEEIFAELARMGYEKPSTKLNFYKAFFGLMKVPHSYNSSILVRNVDSPSKFYMYPRFLQLMLNAQIVDLSSHNTKFTSSALIQKVFANMRRVVESNLPPSPHQSPIAQPSSPSLQQPSQPEDISYSAMALLNQLLETCATLTKKVGNLEQDKRAQAIEITKLKKKVRRLEKKRKLKALGFKRLRKVGTAQRVESSTNTIMNDQEDASKQGEFLNYLEHADKVLSMQETNEAEPAEVEEVIKVVTAAKLMTEVVTTAAATTTATPITAATTITAALVPKASALRRRRGVIIQDLEEAATASEIMQSEDEAFARELEVELNANINWNKVIEQVKRKEREGNKVMRYQALKRKHVTEVHARKNMMVYLNNMAGFKMDFFKGMTYTEIRPIFKKHFNSIWAFLKKGENEIEEEESKESKSKSENLEQKAAKNEKIDDETEDLKTHLQIIPNDEDDVYTKATPLALKVPVIEYQIHTEHNKPYYKIIRAYGTHQLFLSFISLLRNFNRKDLEMLRKIVQERFESSEPKNFSDDFLLNALKTMFEKPNIEANIWRNQRGIYGLAKVKSWKLFESCGVHIITFITTQMIMLVERRYHLTRFTLEQMLTNVRLEVEEESEMSLELLRLLVPKQKFSPSGFGFYPRLLTLYINLRDKDLHKSKDPQRKYVREILERAGMVNCNLSRTPVDAESKLGGDGDAASDLTLYRNLADADWAGCPSTIRSTSGYYVFIGNNLLSWSSKCQPTLSRSSAEAEYHGVANAHQHTKYIEIDIHFARDLVSAGQVRLLHVPSHYQYADIFTKGLPSALFEELRSSLSVRCPPVQTAGKDVVHYAVNSFSEKYNQVCGYMLSRCLSRPQDGVIFVDYGGDAIEVQGTYFTHGLLFSHGPYGSISDRRYMHDSNAKPVDISSLKQLVTTPSLIPHAFLFSQHTWHQRLGHPGSNVLHRLVSNNIISCNKKKTLVLCHACQLGKHVRLLFVSSSTIVASCFDIIHSDVWTSPIPSLSGYKYHVLFLDHYSLFVWVYPLLYKYDVLSKFVLFRNYVRTHFKSEIQSFQCDHGGEFDNRTLHKLFANNAIQFCFSCPKTSQQNSKSEWLVCTINNIIWTLLFQANLPPTFWVEALNMAVHLLNILPSTAIDNEIPYTRLFGTQPDYNLLLEPNTTNNLPLIIYDPPNNPNPFSVHSMVTRLHVGSNRPTERLNLLVSSVSPLPKSYRDAFNDLNWQYAMCDEYNALIKNHTWTLVPRPPDANIVWCMWLFRHKYLADGSLSHYKARLMANGSTELEGILVVETFSPVVKPGIIRPVLSLATSRHWLVHQLDVKNAFLHGDLSETQIISSLHQEFSMTGLGALNYFLGISVSRDYSGMFSSQHKYAGEILERAGMVNCNPSRTPVDTKSKLVQLVCLYMHDPQMEIGLVVLLPNVLPPATVFFLPTIYCHGPLSVSRRFLVLVLRLSIVRTKHIEIDIYFVRDLVGAGQLRVLHVPSCYQYADIFTKGLPSALFEELRSSLSVRCPLAQTAGEC
nr:ribonuclease H-like domain-containing protein [Tanacetum cinerariifolium]